MKRNLLLLGVTIMVVFFCTNQSMAQCPEDPGDLGICDTLYVEIFDCDHQYQASAGYDSVRVAIYVTHDSNTFWWSGGNRWVQDSILAFTIPLTFWHPPEGCVDSVILPDWDDWNNVEFDPEWGNLHRSIFRHLVDAHTGDTTFNRKLKLNQSWPTRILDIEHLSCDGDSGHAWLHLSGGGARKKWYEGSKVLLATLTFLVYMDSSCDSTAICLDTMSAPPGWNLVFVKYNSTGYTPRHFLPVCETIYVLRGDVNGDGRMNISDLVYLINYLFVLGSPAPAPLWAGDVNCDKIVNISDVVFLINYLFIPGSPPPPAGCP